MPRQRLVASGGWKIVRSVVAKRIKAKVITRQHLRNGGTGTVFTKSQLVEIRGIARLMQVEHEKKITNLSSEVKDLSETATHCREILELEALKCVETVKLETSKYGFAMFGAVGGVVLASIGLLMQQFKGK